MRFFRFHILDVLFDCFLDSFVMLHFCGFCGSSLQAICLVLLECTDFVLMLLEDMNILFQVVLVSAGTELTFFLVAGTMLCFGFSVRMMLITL